jgi:FixJ family two-component response regulator
MNPEDFIVFIVDDVRMREALSELLASLGWQAVAFGSAGEYIAYPRPDLPACLILDVELPDINGLDFQKQISHGDHPPIVFLTGHGDIPSSVRAIKHGAVDVLTKPFTERDLLEAIRAELGISEVTLQIHRSKIMQQMEAASLADLVRIAEKLQIPVTHSRRAGNT